MTKKEKKHWKWKLKAAILESPFCRTEPQQIELNPDSESMKRNRSTAFPFLCSLPKSPPSTSPNQISMDDFTTSTAILLLPLHLGCYLFIHKGKCCVNSMQKKWRRTRYEQEIRLSMKKGDRLVRRVLKSCHQEYFLNTLRRTLHHENPRKRKIFL